MPIIPLRAEFENFLSFQEKQEFVFAHTGLHYIYGIDYDADVQDGFTIDQYNIGVGKTSLAMLMQFAFYGKIQKKINMDQIINKFTKSDLYVQFDFILNGDEYRIERYRKHRLYDDNIFLYRKIKNKFENISHAEKRQTQQEINKLIVLDIRTFEKSILFTREDKIQFLELPTIDRGMIFENIAQINKLRDYWDKAKKRLRELEDDISVVNNNILKVSTIINRDKEYIESAEEDYKNDKKKIEKEIKDIEGEIKEIALITSIDEVKENLKNYHNANGLIKKCEDEIETLEANKKSEKDRMDKLDDEIARLEESISRQAKKHNKLKPTKCVNCGAIQNEKEYKDEIAAIKKDIDASTKALISFKDSVKGYKKSIRATEKQLIIVNETLNECEKSKEYYRDQIPTIIFEDESKLNDLDNLYSRITILRTSLESIAIDSKIEKLNKEIAERTIELNEYQQEKNELMLTKRMLDFWCDVLDFKTENSLKQYVIAKIIPLFNHLLQQIIDAVYRGDMLISFDNFFQETIIYKNEIALYEELSTGEKAKLNFCIYLAIFDLTRINLDGSKVIFMDEIFNNTDIPTIMTFIDIIRERYSKDNAIYIISHQQTVKENLNPDSIIRIEKKENSSKVMIEDKKIIPY